MGARPPGVRIASGKAGTKFTIEYLEKNDISFRKAPFYTCMLCLPQAKAK